MLIVPPGSGSDILGRKLAEFLPEAGESAAVLNKPETAAQIAFDYVGRAPPDGRALVLAASAVRANPYMLKALKIDTLNAM